jgi:heat shock protein HslJ
VRIVFRCLAAVVLSSAVLSCASPEDHSPAGTAPTSSYPPTCLPAGYSYLDYEKEGTSALQQGITLTKAIWGPYQVRFSGTAGLPDGARLVTWLYRDGQAVDWWPSGRTLFVEGGAWEAVAKAGQFDLPAEFPPPGPGYSLQVFEVAAAAPGAEFSLDFPPPAIAAPDFIPSAVLEGSEWRLVSIDGHRLIPFTRVTLRFQENGFAGSGGCNSYGGNHVVTTGGLINLHSIMSTLVACLPPVNRQEEEYLTRLNDAACYRLVDNRLELYDIVTSGRTLVFERQAD